MKFAHWFTSVMLVGAASMFLASAGCAKDNKGGQPGKDGQAQNKDDKKNKKEHSEWWCQEHGVPEELCSLCMAEADAKVKYKDKGDWCPLHDRAQSQCFKCEPALYRKYEALYEVKFDKKPPRPAEEEFQK